MCAKCTRVHANFHFRPSTRRAKHARNKEFISCERSREKRRHEMNFLNISYAGECRYFVVCSTWPARNLWQNQNIAMPAQQDEREEIINALAQCFRPMRSEPRGFPSQARIFTITNHKFHFGVWMGSEQQSTESHRLMKPLSRAPPFPIIYLASIFLSPHRVYAAWLATNFHTAHALNFDCDWCGPEWEINTKKQLQSVTFWCADAERVSASGVTKHFSK